MWTRNKLAFLLILSATLAAAQVDRVVVLKVDGLPPRLLDQYLRSPATPRAPAKWLDFVFARNGATLDNFYTRGLSLSAPSWSLLDTGRHLEIRGNVEYDRYTLNAYDYLNFVPFYFKAGVGSQVDMPAVELLDQNLVPLLIDRFPFASWIQGAQLLQRGVNWQTMDGALKRALSANSVRGFLDEWQVGWSWKESWTGENEELMTTALMDPQVRYLELFSGEFDHVAHVTNDSVTQMRGIESLDALVGRVWNAIQKSPRAATTALVLVSDHGMNTFPTITSQGYNLVEWFNSGPGGGHHVLTNRHPLQEFKFRGLDPFVSKVITPSAEPNYLAGQSAAYPTVMLDLDGNERAGIGLRNNTFNVLHALLDQLLRRKVAGQARVETLAALFRTIDSVRVPWQADIDDLNAELSSLLNRIAIQESIVDALPKKWTKEQIALGLNRDGNREARRLHQLRGEHESFTAYAAVIARLLSLTPADFDPGKFKMQDLVPPRSLGPANSIWDLQNYAVGVDPDGSILRMNYLPALAALSVRNNVQKDVGAQPIDFTAVRLDDTSIWLYGDEERQAIISYRAGALRYQPIAHLIGNPDGSVVYEDRPWGPGFPLHIFEDPTFKEGAVWLSQPHSEQEWLQAVHKTQYSNGIIGLVEQVLDLSPAPTSYLDRKRRQRRTDLLVLANDHWNFNARGFNPGGNHGSFLRESTHSVLMFAGGQSTGIPRGAHIETPYDSLSFAPTILTLMGIPEADLPGPIIKELTEPIQLHK